MQKKTKEDEMVEMAKEKHEKGKKFSMKAVDMAHKMLKK